MAQHLNLNKTKVRLELMSYRVEGNTVTLSGTGEAGKLVAIYKGTDSTIQCTYTSTSIGSNGLWSATVSVTS